MDRFPGINRIELNNDTVKEIFADWLNEKVLNSRIDHVEVDQVITSSVPNGSITVIFKSIPDDQDH